MVFADWHRGTVDACGSLKLSSRKLLNLVMRLPSSSEFKRLAKPPFGRDGDWTELEKMVAELHNETAANRASKFAGGPNEYEYKVFLSPVDRREKFEKARDEEEFADEARDELFDQLFG